MNQEKLKKIMNHYGKEAQEELAIEESSELIKAIIKHRRYHTVETENDLAEEIADVLIMVNQLMLMNGFEDNYIEAIILRKIGRTLERIEQNEIRNNSI